MAEQRRAGTHEDKKEEVPNNPKNPKSSTPKKADRVKKIKEDIDKLVSEIDDILEENAEEFMKSYVQRGGE